MKRLIFVFVVFALAAFCQNAPLVNPIDGPPGGMAMEHYYAYSGSNLVYHCIAPSRQNISTAISITAGSNAAAASLTSAAHGLNPYATPLVTISGATGLWAPLNGTWTATITGANTFTVPVASTGFSTFTGTVTFVTRAPRLSQAVWAVQSFIYSSSLLVTSGWVGGATSFTNVCAAPTQVQ
jgi:hypothetical protein